jgi:hypothetical protein
MDILFTNSQKKTYDFYKNHTKKFNSIIKIEKDNEIIVVETDNEFYYIGKLGGLTVKLKR